MHPARSLLECDLKLWLTRDSKRYPNNCRHVAPHGRHVATGTQGRGWPSSPTGSSPPTCSWRSSGRCSERTSATCLMQVPMFPGHSKLEWHFTDNAYSRWHARQPQRRVFHGQVRPQEGDDRQLHIHIIVGISYPYIADALDDYGFVPVICTLDVFFVSVLKMVPETSDKSNENIQAGFQKQNIFPPVFFSCSAVYGKHYICVCDSVQRRSRQVYHYVTLVKALPMSNANDISSTPVAMGYLCLWGLRKASESGG